MEKITSSEQFQQLISTDKEVLIKFFADWCPDCTRMNFFIDEIIEEYKEYQWFEINKDEFPEIAEQYQVMGIPSILIFKNGEKLGHLHSANAKTPEQVQEFLAEKL
ncbi:MULTISPECIES: thioredoxin family protein [Bacillaceae]|uniref:Thioredoxin n=2 Tax=Metabacillus TaxID=2675233 RepID=A0ABS5L9P7_9BACI|nr:MULTISPECIES: thioredoxin family protein [Bacillaceae]KZZ85198.1 thiol reductase thioredoxin [Bacillus sp. SJS]MBS2967450.1 thioredoxin family protein [Metabacillus flavus]